MYDDKYFFVSLPVQRKKDPHQSFDVVFLVDCSSPFSFLTYKTMQLVFDLNDIMEIIDPFVVLANGLELNAVQSTGRFCEYNILDNNFFLQHQLHVNIDYKEKLITI